jgi:hypothetical protein
MGCAVVLYTFLREGDYVELAGLCRFGKTSAEG